MSILLRPRALLLDFGGVVISTTGRSEWAAELAQIVHGQLTHAGTDELTIEDVLTDIVAGAAADSHWKNAMSRPYAPAEMTHRRFWRDFVAADWPEAARELVTIEASDLCKIMGERRQVRDVRSGMTELLDLADDLGVAVAVVSNALSGVVHREFLEREGLDKRFALQVYSDESGVRKPNPEMIWLAVRALGLEPADAWYVGDNFDRDVVCGRRAGAGATVLMEARSTYDRPYAVRDLPDLVVEDPDGLRQALAAAAIGQ